MRNEIKDFGNSEHNHYISEWAEHRGLSRADIAREIGADRSLVGRWFSGMIPSERWLEPLAELLQTEVAGLFRHPDDDWISKMFRGKTEEQKEAAIQMLKLFFRDTVSPTIASEETSKKIQK